MVWSPDGSKQITGAAFGLVVSLVGSASFSATPADRCSSANEIAYIHSANIREGGGIGVRRANGAIETSLVPFAPICSGDQPFALGQSTIQIRVIGGEIRTVSASSRWVEPTVRRAPIRSNVFGIILDKLQTDASRWMSPQRARGDQQGSPRVELPGVAAGQAILWQAELISPIQLPVSQALKIRRIEVYAKDQPRHLVGTMEFQKSHFQWAGPFETGQYTLTGIPYGSAPKVDLGGFGIVAGSAPSPDGYLATMQYYGESTALGLRAVWLADTRPVQGSLMAYQLASRATLAGSKASAVQRAVVTIATSSRAIGGE
jgi:hypothetical protein